MENTKTSSSTLHALSSKPHASFIAVIADDFTGAAEVGGIALRQGFAATIVTSLSASCEDTEVLIVAANTRAESSDNAKQTISELTTALLALKPEFIYKKIDSVLRGNVGTELCAQMEVSGKSRALIVPSNPSLNRIVKNGIYYENGQPLNRSRFSVGENNEQLSPNVIDLIGESAAQQTTVIAKGEELPAEGLIIGNASDEADLDHWAKQLDHFTVMAGAASFFNALLKSKNKKGAASKVFVLGQRKLYVCGSAFEVSRQVVAALRHKQIVAYMPANLFSKAASKDKLMNEWEEQIIASLKEHDVAVIAVDALNTMRLTNLPALISQAMAQVVKRVIDKISVQELLVEGGHTAASIVAQLGYQKFCPVQELALGVIRMRAVGKDDLFITLKPGSYHWPPAVWLDEI